MKQLLQFFLLLFLLNCTTTEFIERKTFEDLSSATGEPKYYQTTNKIAIHLFGVYPVIENAKFDSTLNEFSKAAKKKNATKIQLIQRETYKWYLVYFPVSLVLTPVSTEIVGEVY